METRRITIRDIAEELGLSTATVSNVIHGKTGKVSEATVRRVEAALEQRQYIPSMAGILLARNDSRIIGVVVNDHEKYEGRVLEDFFVSASINHLSNGIEADGRFLMVKKARGPEDIIRFASMWNLDGLVLMGFCDEDYRYLRSHMRIPFVVYDGYCCGETGVCNITVDNFGGGMQVGQYFRQTGHQRAVCIADNDVCVDQERYDGFRAGFGPGVERLIVPMQKESRWNFYREQMDRLRTYTAAFAVSDYYAVDLMQFLRQAGLRVPEDLAVAGFDDTPMCTMVVPSLTSVSQDIGLRAQIAVQKLRQLRENSLTEHDVRLPAKLVLRDSTKRT